ncbi:hypothetical protein NPIL_441331 [Nephila pilipes]|uniref:Uncharacterized protein n=1 Tax=Nephila pilipes TaxID=299642 RepID=A0A8X6PAS3_NEPPI|nr:hypothetical protein NPIL_441331 [Nephila pilipes]
MAIQCRSRSSRQLRYPPGALTSSAKTGGSYRSYFGTTVTGEVLFAFVVTIQCRSHSSRRLRSPRGHFPQVLKLEAAVYRTSVR